MPAAAAARESARRLINTDGEEDEEDYSYLMERVALGGEE
jgi:hypothetical protein